MQQIQDRLDFKIATPSDEEIRQHFEDEFFPRRQKVKRKLIFKSVNGRTKNQKKRDRKAKA
jgi:hypothetical protein